VMVGPATVNSDVITPPLVLFSISILKVDTVPAATELVWRYVLNSHKPAGRIVVFGSPTRVMYPSPPASSMMSPVAPLALLTDTVSTCVPVLPGVVSRDS
jgi:hypothetical protein